MDGNGGGGTNNLHVSIILRPKSKFTHSHLLSLMAISILFINLNDKGNRCHYRLLALCQAQC